jgi:hypothetical protein
MGDALRRRCDLDGDEPRGAPRALFDPDREFGDFRTGELLAVAADTRALSGWGTAAIPAPLLRSPARLRSERPLCAQHARNYRASVCAVQPPQRSNQAIGRP